MSNSTSFDAKLELRLKRAELVNDDQLNVIRELQKESPLSLAEALVELDYLSAREIDSIVHSLGDVRNVKLEDLQIDIDAVKHVPRSLAVKCRCIPIRRSGNTLVIAVSDANFESVREELRQVTDFEVVLLLAESDAIEHALFIYYGEESGKSKSAKASDYTTHVRSPWSLRPAWNYSFESFVAHEGVQRAKEIAKQVVSGGSESHNSPILFIGPEGSGKTHLLMAIKNYCSAKDPLLRGVYCNGEQLKTLITEYSLAGCVGALRYDMRDCSLLLIDDIAGCWGSEGIEAEVADTIHILIANGAAVIVSTTNEQYIAGPTTKGLRDLMMQGTELHLTAPDSVTQSEILEMRRSPSCGQRPSEKEKLD